LAALTRGIQDGWRFNILEPRQRRFVPMVASSIGGQNGCKMIVCGFWLLARPGPCWVYHSFVFRTGGNMADKELDARGLNCPLPILRAKKALNDMSSGQTLHILATDPGSVKDFEAFAKQTGNALVESSEKGGEFSFLLKKA